jgi:signal transduction histidine kinase
VVNSLTHAFTPEQTGQISIHAWVESTTLKMEYRDNGMGITADILPQIFNPFFTTKRGHGGTGLGLYLSYSLINKLHGTIRCESTPNLGVCFIMNLPLLTPEP